MYRSKSLTCSWLFNNYLRSIQENSFFFYKKKLVIHLLQKTWWVWSRNGACSHCWSSKKIWIGKDRCRTHIVSQIEFIEKRRQFFHSSKTISQYTRALYFILKHVRIHLSIKHEQENAQSISISERYNCPKK